MMMLPITNHDGFTLQNRSLWTRIHFAVSLLFVTRVSGRGEHFAQSGVSVCLFEAGSGFPVMLILAVP
jgi:hypothetical protein